MNLPALRYDTIEIEVLEDPSSNGTKVFRYANCKLEFALGDVRSFYSDSQMIRIDCKKNSKLRSKAPTDEAVKEFTSRFLDPEENHKYKCRCYLPDFETDSKLNFKSPEYEAKDEAACEINKKGWKLVFNALADRVKSHKDSEGGYAHPVCPILGHLESVFPKKSKHIKEMK